LVLPPQLRGRRARRHGRAARARRRVDGADLHVRERDPAAGARAV
jgi:hypothetical protein